MGMMAGGGKGSPVSDPNIVPLIDVLLVLIIIFMVITPTVPTGLPTLVPQRAATQAKPELADPPWAGHLDAGFVVEGRAHGEDHPAPQQRAVLRHPGFLARHAHADENDVGVEGGDLGQDLAVVRRFRIGVEEAVAPADGDVRAADLSHGTVFYLYTPFSGAILRDVLNSLRQEAVKREIRICTFGPCTQVVAEEQWLSVIGVLETDQIAIFRSHDHT